MTNEEISVLHNNHYLFSDHFLNVLLKQNKKWAKQWVEVEKLATPFGEWLQKLYQTEKEFLPQYNEAQLEEHWFKPIFRHLGHTFEGQTPIPALLDESIKYPDYLFFTDESGRQSALQQLNSPAVVQSALAVGEVKKWGTPLNRKSEKGYTFAENNPSFQIDYYVRATGLNWGILSNGKLWRLVHKDSSYKLDIYFEIDLEKSLTAQSTEAIAFFLLFFHQHSLRPDLNTGRSFLDDVLQESIAYTIKLEEDIREKAYFALEQLIQGFFEVENNQLTEQDLPQIYTNSLYLLYRFIFLFYGESRGLLPTNNPVYQTKFSFKKITNQIANQLENGQPFYKNGRQIWYQLLELFTIIEGRLPAFNQELGVPIYNGGLFNAQIHPFLEEKFVGDYFLAQAIDALARRMGEEQTLELVDYRSLGVRQIGSIYEGLLEYQALLATEPLVSVKKENSERWILEADVAKNSKIVTRKAAGQIYLALATDKGARKTTGSYYTPDYIVKYMVEESLGPLVTAAEERVKQQTPLSALGYQFAAEILKLRVLDPAMGSAHFLVEATDYLARKIATHNATLQNGQTNIDEDDLINWRRQVAEQCIYGVDKNLLAVELAKLSLWLITAAKDKPLSFLDHHLRHGDSLVGATLSELVKLPSSKKEMELPSNQPPLYLDTHFTQDIFRAVGGMNQISRLLSDTVADVHLKSKTFQELQEVHLARWRDIANLWTSHFFGNTMTSQAWAILSEYLQRGIGKEEEFPELKILAHHLEHPAVKNQDYFHWELEFPEIFFDEQGQLRHETAGFDVVISNPPYVRQEYLKIYKPLFEFYYTVYTGTADLYLYFYERGFKFLKPHVGRMGYITSGTFARTNSAKPFREWFSKNAQIETLIDFGENQPFAEAEMVRPSIVILSNQFHKHNFNVLFMEGTKILHPFQEALTEFGFEADVELLENSEWIFQPNHLKKLSEKIFSRGIPLEEIQKTIFRGILTGLNEAFYLTEEQKDKILSKRPETAALLTPFLRGADLRPWYQKKEGRWLVTIPQGWTYQQYGSQISTDIAQSLLSNQFPELFNYLQPFQEEAQKRLDKGDFWWELRPCNYYEEFRKPKILWNDITKLPRFSWDNENYFVNQKGYILPNAQPSLLAILQSRVNWFAISRKCTPLRLRAGLWQYQVLSQFVKRLPIPHMNTNEQEHLGHLAIEITNLANQRYQLHQLTKHRIEVDLSVEEGVVELNQKLSTWWLLSFKEFRAEIKKLFKRDIPLKERQEWENYLKEQQTQHQTLTNQIIALEIELNKLVYQLYNLTPEEIALVEDATKYPYGAV